MDSNGTKDSSRRQLLFDDPNKATSPTRREDVNLMSMHDLKNLDSIHARMDEKMIPKIGT